MPPVNWVTTAPVASRFYAVSTLALLCAKARYTLPIHPHVAFIRRADSAWRCRVAPLHITRWSIRTCGRRRVGVWSTASLVQIITHLSRLPYGNNGRRYGRFLTRENSSQVAHGTHAVSASRQVALPASASGIAIAQCTLVVTG